VHVAHAFRNLNRERRGDAVRTDLVQQPRIASEGAGWRDELLGALPEMFFEVHRLVLEPGTTAQQHTADRFQVLNVVEGDGAVISWAGRKHELAYAETMVVPAAVGDFEVSALGATDVRIVRAFVS
jgi:quercetin dioxygenase-like cupin family protein